MDCCVAINDDGLAYSVLWVIILVVLVPKMAMAMTHYAG